ncbi:uncharacterized protein LOC117534630 isoform X4 [Scomber scombrus]|uniref:Uncharacterized protein LOC117534630 isoform X4 n=1 Tax=Scomber scombrus TaxID=13677 RepID=A0AAV1PVE2_SCOSC
MDPEMARQLMDLKVHDRYPEGTTSKQRYVIKRRADNFLIKEHLAKVITTAEEANSVFVEFHRSGIGGHFGVEKTQSAIITRYYWPGIQDIRKWIAQCPECRAKRAVIKEKTEYEPIQIATRANSMSPLCSQIVNSYLAAVGNSTGAGIVDAYTKTAVWQGTHRHFRRSSGPQALSGCREVGMLFNQSPKIAGHNILWRVCMQDELAQLCRACWEESSGADTDNWSEDTLCCD